MGWAAMRRVIALLGGIVFVFAATSGAAAELPASLSGTVQLTAIGLLPHSNADGQLRRASARADDRDALSGFRTEVEAFEEAVEIGGTPLGLKTGRVMLSGLYEFSSGGWRMKPYIGAGVGVMDVNARLLTHEESTLLGDLQFKGGVNFNFTQKLLGKLEWRWSHGSKPTFAFAGIPTKFQLKRGGFLLGFNYKL
jgi:opacity protein-like surface antigen